MVDVKTLAGAQILILAAATLIITSLTSCAGASRMSAGTSRAATHSQQARALRHGARLYERSCSSCHGENAHGTGPVAPVLGAPVPDLTLIAARRGGAFPVDELYRIIDGQADLPAHGRHMPVWGYEFFGNDPDDEAAHRQASEKIESLVRYLRSIQRSQ